MAPLGLYVHVPFCVRKCAYCDFNAYSGMAAAVVDGYVRAVIEEIRRGPEQGTEAATVFFGGGTPTYLHTQQLHRILQALRESYRIVPEAEISAEANPGTVDAGRFRRMRRAGFNRLSLGIQAFDDSLLARLDRTHSATEAEAAFHAARQAGFSNISLDLMFGLPGQTLSDWRATLERAIQLGPEHLSTYSLTLEPGTRFERLHAGGKLSLPDEETSLEMYEHAISRLSAAGYEHYEVSNFARPGFRALHNLTYWRNEEYLGFGPGAVSYLDGRRWTNEKHPGEYQRKVCQGQGLAVDSECLPPEKALAETLIQGLRLREGVELSRLRARFGIDPLQRFGAVIRRFEANGMLALQEGRLRLTHEGLLMADSVCVELV